MARVLGKAASEKKAENVVLYDVRDRSSYADAIVVMSADSSKHMEAIAEAVEASQRPLGNRPLGREESVDHQWWLLDYGDVVVHVFSDAARRLYDLDGMWTDAPQERIAP